MSNPMIPNARRGCAGGPGKRGGDDTTRRNGDSKGCGRQRETVTGGVAFRRYHGPQYLNTDDEVQANSDTVTDPEIGTSAMVSRNSELGRETGGTARAGRGRHACVGWHACPASLAGRHGQQLLL